MVNPLSLYTSYSLQLLCFSPISMSLSSVLSAAVSSSSLSLYLRSPLSALLKPPKCVISRLHWSSYNLIVTIATIDQLARLATCLHTSSKVNVNNSSVLIIRAKCFKIFLAQMTQKQNMLKIQAFINRNSIKKHEHICTENWNIARNDSDSSEVIRTLGWREHVTTVCCHKTGSLLQLSSANFTFTAVDVAAYGSQSGGGVWRISAVGRRLFSNKFDIPLTNATTKLKCNVSTLRKLFVYKLIHNLEI
uniref:Uncharacterized protein n=1 Tax=Glossina palpalis gambiensis TaxID=67801 RepID=A0A1B0BDP9_9MUSC